MVYVDDNWINIPNGQCLILCDFVAAPPHTPALEQMACGTLTFEPHKNNLPDMIHLNFQEHTLYLKFHWHGRRIFPFYAMTSNFCNERIFYNELLDEDVPYVDGLDVDVPDDNVLDAEESDGSSTTS